MLSTIIEEVLRLENLLKREIGPSLRLRLLFSVIFMFEYEQNLMCIRVSVFTRKL